MTARRTAVQHAAAATTAWRCTTGAQRAAVPDHSDFYALAGELVDTLHNLGDLAAVLSTQVIDYGTAETLRDDQPGHNPQQRLLDADHHLHDLQRHLHVAERAADQFWSAIGHIAVEDPR